MSFPYSCVFIPTINTVGQCKYTSIALPALLLRCVIQSQIQPQLEPKSRENLELWNSLLVLQQSKEAFLKEDKAKAFMSILISDIHNWLKLLKLNFLRLLRLKCKIFCLLFGFFFIRYLNFHRTFKTEINLSKLWGCLLAEWTKYCN